MTNYEWLLQMGGEERQAWFDAQHVYANDDLPHENDASAGAVDANDTCDALKLMREFCVADILDALGIDHREKNHTRKMVQALADMVERDYVSRESIEGVMDADRELVAENIRLTAERDEWKAKAEGLTEALEKLGCSVLANGTVFEPAPHVDAHSKAQSKTEPMLSEQSESLSDESDSREKLEEDVKETIDFWGAAYPDARVRIALGWLDRQAAITRHEVLTQPDERDEQIAELTAQVDELSQQLINARADCEQYRELLSQAITHAHEIVNLQP